MVRSFDLFDTLIGRLHYHPESVFNRVEEQCAFPGFAAFRRAAAIGSDHTLAGIYRKFQEMLGASDALCQALMEWEFKIDLESVFPIPETLALVQDGDLIVSDTYYEREQILQILEKIGLKKRVEVVATPSGKRSGEIWSLLQKNHSIESHLGDSVQADVNSPLKQGIKGIHYANSRLTDEESSLCVMGQESLAFLVRSLRLSNPYLNGSLEWSLWNEQARFNVPLLIQASLFLDLYCSARGFKRILFTARDSCLWIKLFRHLFPQYESIYFHSSRFIYSSPTPAFTDYVDGLYQQGTVIVDVRGTGKTCRGFFQAHLGKEPHYLSIVNSSSFFDGMLRRKTIWDQSRAVEMLNYDTCGTLYDFSEVGPLRAEVEYPLEGVRAMHACIDHCVQFLPSFVFDTFDQQVLEWALYLVMDFERVVTKALPYAYFHCHVRDQEKWHHVQVLYPNTLDRVVFH